MKRYSLFKKLADGASIWVCDADDLAEIVGKMRVLAGQTGLEHFVHDFRFGMVVATSRDLNPQNA